MVHAQPLVWRWMTRIGAIPWTLMVTFSKVPDDRIQARKGWQSICKVLRTCGSTGYLRSMELGPKNGMRHYHVLLSGITRLDLPRINAVCSRAGYGFVWATKIKDRQKASRYLLKYPFKDLGQYGERTRGWRIVTASRSVPSWSDVQRKFRGETFLEEGWTLATNRIER